ncbi:MAG: hypothetical protein VYE73_03050, partial [Acidobacteriota bacterium]|nr:hypothetical protein [Acidobacteriota bacterium]
MSRRLCLVLTLSRGACWGGEDAPSGGPPNGGPPGGGRAAAGGNGRPGGGGPPPLPVQVATASQTALVRSLSAVGSMQSPETTVVAADISGLLV